jgi:hypothetical protein
MADAKPLPVPLVATGFEGEYQWLATEHNLDTLLELCPQAFLSKYIAVTALDSGAVFLTDEQNRAGWQSRNGIAYSPQVQSVKSLPHGESGPDYGGSGAVCGGFDEWYIFDRPFDLGQKWQGNVFEAPMQPGQVAVFVNFLGFAVHLPEMQPIAKLFWKQLDLIRPESFVADGDDYLTFVSCDKTLFTDVREALIKLVANSR